MKKKLLVVLSLAIFVSILSIKVCAQEEKSLISITKEPAMPMINSQTYNMDSNNIGELREEWVQEIFEYNETIYNQEIVSVIETDECYIFEFEPNKNKIEKIIAVDGEEYKNVQIDRVLYYKPEISNNQYSTYAVVPSDPGAGIPTKIVEYYGWGANYYDYSTKSGILQSILNLSIGVVFAEYTIVSWVLSEALGDLFDLADKLKDAKAIVKHKYYYRNKVGYMYSSSTTSWLPLAYVGERRTFALNWGIVHDKFGQPMSNIQEKYGTPSSNPTNWDFREKKAHYDDDEWIMNKAIETSNSGGYYDVFANVSNK